MNKREIGKRMLVLLLTMTMILSCLNTGVASKASKAVKAQELATATDSEVSAVTTGENEGENFEYEDTYNSENFDVNFKLDNVWDTGYNATITVTNTSDSIIDNWCLTFPFNETISDIWNAAISETHDNFYVIKNVGWNQDIAEGQSVSFGITVYEEFTEFPEYYTIIGNQVETKREDYTVDYKITEDWGVGYKAEITITNNKDTAIEDWRLSFDYGDNLITQIWNAVVVDNTNGRYELSCETYNQNIEPRASVSFGFMVEPGCSGKLMEKVVLKEYVAEESKTDVDNGNEEEDEKETGDNNEQEMVDSENLAIIYGYVDENTDILFLETMASVECEKREVYTSKDEKDYQLLGNTDEEGYLEYILDEDFASMEIYALCYGENGKKIESNHIYVENKNGLYTAVMPDTDQDGLEDYYEIYYGCDTSLADTDGDGLSDYYEITVCLSDPTKPDTDDDGTLDGNEDIDNDNLTTLDELALGTNPVFEDSDRDDVIDGDEVNAYFTDPMLGDTDGDTLNDGDEIGLKLNPKLIDTDGDNILDNEEKFTQTFDYVVENEECVVDEISIQINGSGYLQNNTYINSVMEEDTFCANVVGLVGEPYEITTTCEFDEATITFKVDMDGLGETDFEDLMFMWYDEDNHEFVELETQHYSDLGWVSVKTNHFSKYMIVDKEEWYAAWAKELNYGNDKRTEYSEYYTMLLIESDKAMSRIDPITRPFTTIQDEWYMKQENYRIGFASNYIDNKRDNEKISVCLFNLGVDTWSEFTTDKDELMLQFAALDSVGTKSELSYTLPATIVAFKKAPGNIYIDDSVCKRVILITQSHKPTSLEYAQTEFLRYGIQLDVIVLGGDTECTELKDMCEATGGRLFVVEDLDELSRLYYNIYNETEIDTTDSDGDMLYDIVETEGIRLKNGQIIYTKPYSDDSDGDSLLDGEEIDPELVFDDTSNVLRKSSYRFYYNWYSDPTNIDTDGDGIRDDVDNRPFERGYYSDEAGKIVVGKLTIVASMYNATGHSYLLYESYIKDAFGLNNLTGGYEIYINNEVGYSYIRKNKGTLYLSPGDYITIGNSMAATEFGFLGVLEGKSEADESFKDNGGIYYNREVAEEIKEYKKSGKEKYNRNAAYSRFISEEERNSIISFHKQRNYYNIVSNNCNEVAIGAWNYAFGVSDFSITPLPSKLKKQIQSKEGSHSISLQKIWGIR